MARNAPTRLVLLNIGQAPRFDLAEAIERGLPAHIQARHVGVLDGLGRSDVEQQFAAGDGRPWLISKLADGGTVTLDAHLIDLRLQQTIERLEDEETDVIVLLCTGEFPALRAKRAWLVEPDAVVCSTIASLLGAAQAGVVVPLPPQVEEARAKWRHLKTPALFESASPYDASPQPLVRAARALQDRGAQALVLDCMGYAPSHKAALVDAGVDLPILVSGSVLAGALSAFF
jgi:protein AroM